MRICGLTISYKEGINKIFDLNGNLDSQYHAGELLFRTFQGETLDNISRITRTMINACPMDMDTLTQDTIELAEEYILSCLKYEDFFPAQILAQGSFIRCAENYRAIDTRTRCYILAQEQKRTDSNKDLFRNIGFNTIGEFLRLCFNNYFIDLINARLLFTAMAAVKSGTASDEENASYDELCEVLSHPGIVPGIERKARYDMSTCEFTYSFVISSFLAMVVFEFAHIDESSMRVIRCKNPACRKFFSARRSTAKYCYFPSPQDPNRNCCDYYPQIKYQAKLHEQELDRLIKNAFSRLYMDRKRHPEKIEEITELILKLEDEAYEKKEKVMNKSMTTEQFKTWLKTIRREKGKNHEFHY